jgi:hypothetical protein
MTGIISKLKGGDRRSIGRANEVAQEVEQNPHLFEALFNGLYDEDPIIRMRSADAIEKVTQTQPQLLSGYTSKLISILELPQQQEVCWYLAQIVPRVEYSEEEAQKVIFVLKQYLNHKSKIVEVCAMEALAGFAEKNPLILNEMIHLIETRVKDGSPAVKSLGRKLLHRLYPKSQ